MTARADFLVELGTEELPPKALARLSRAFAEGIRAGLEKQDLDHGELRAFATPRRLAVQVAGLACRQPDKQMERRGPALAAAFDEEGCPTPAAQGFARSCGVAVEELATLETDKGSWLVYRSEQPGREARELLPDIVAQALAGLPIPKRMRWGSIEHQFVRPVHWLVMLLGESVVECELLGQRAGRETRGHRFHHPASLSLPEPGAYEALLESEGYVITDFQRRREAIVAQVEEAALQLGGRAVIDPALLEEVTGLVEWPRAIAGSFDAAFLEIPAEALISAMRGHQKYFHLVDGEGRLMSHFITVANIDSRRPATVRAGNERVIRPRLSDADFFWKQDRKQPLARRLDSLKSVIFQQRLGTLYDKSTRLATLAAAVARAMEADAAQAERAGWLAKCDLMTEMVGEFPELQGIMGEYYARHDGEPEPVAVALNEQYMPRFGGDAIPATAIGQALAIADKLDTLVGIFGIGQAPSGDKDPFGLRRAALGVQRILIETPLDLDLRELLARACEGYEAGVLSAEVAGQVYDFMMERLRSYCQDKGFRADEFDAVMALAPARPHDFYRRLQAVQGFRARSEADSLAAANKRIRNILRKAEQAIGDSVDENLLLEAQEKALYQQLQALSEEVGGYIEQGRYGEALSRLASLRQVVDDFFDHVMVMAEDTAVRANRLALLQRLSRLFLGVADISRLQ